MKLIDFGFAKTSLYGKKQLVDFVGTPYYIAPEILKSEHYGSKCDIWSLGVLVYNLMSNSYPFTGKNRTQLFDNIKKGEFQMTDKIWDHVSVQGKAFIKRCLTLD